MKDTSTTTKPSQGDPKKRRRFIKEFRHWRSGKIIRAVDYGYQAFYIGK